MAFVIEASAMPRFAPGDTVTVDYQSLANAWKTTDYAVTLHENGMLRTVNAAADDRSAQIAGNVVTGVGRLALLSAGALPTPSASLMFRVPDPGSPQQRSCSEAARNQLERLTRLDDVLIPQATSRVAQRRAAIEDIEAYKVARGQLDEARAQQLVNERRLLGDASQALQRLVSEREQVLSRIAVRSTFLWPTRSNEFAAPLVVPAREAQFLRALYTGPDFPDLQHALALGATLTPAAGATPAESVQLSDKPYGGAIYLTPAQGRLRLCRPPAALVAAGAAPATTESCANASPEDILLDLWSNIPQFGRYAELPLKNGPFENNVLSATFRADGTLQEAHFETRRAAAETATQAFADAANVALDTAGRIDSAETARRQAAQAEASAALERERQTLAAQAEILRLQAQVGTRSDLTMLQAQRELVEAQLALERSQRELDQFRTRPAN